MERLTLFTGGTGLLGSEIKKIDPINFLYPSHNSFDVTDYDFMKSFLGFSKHSFKTIIHAAALISPPIVNKEPIKAIETNIIGTANIVRLCIEEKLRLIYISTDYVFDGKKGLYTEEDPVNPVNTYAWSKLGGECSVRLYPNSLIIRTSFSPNEFPYPKAFIDQWTTREPVAITALRILKLANSELCGTIHIGGIRQTVKNYAIKSGKTNVQDLSIKDVDFRVPKDTSLDTTKYRILMER